MKILSFAVLLLAQVSSVQAGLPLSWSLETADAVVCGSLGEATGNTKKLTIKSTAYAAKELVWAEYRLNVDCIVNFRKEIVLPDGTQYPEGSNPILIVHRVKQDKDSEYIDILLSGHAPEKGEKKLWLLSWRHEFECYVAQAADGVDGAQERILAAYLAKKEAEEAKERE